MSVGISTIPDSMDKSGLTHHRIITDNANEYTVREEWRDAAGVDVWSDVHVTVRAGAALIAGTGVLG